MPLASFTGGQALANLKGNRLSKWPDGRRDRTRLKGVSSVEFKPGFTLSPGEAIFTMGSCFARNIERRFGEIGFDLPALSLSLPAEERASDTANDLLNKYPVQSILNELRWALDPDERFDEDGLLQVGDGLWHDPHLAGNVTPASRERVLERRAMVEAIYRQIPRCRLVVMTLGLAEAWFDTRTGLYLNTAPPRALVLADPKRFRLDVLSVAEISGALEAIHDLLRRFGHPEVRLLVTVSPVPFKATFTGRDAITANTYSKSALRAAAESLVLAHANVEYFPSYEVVTTTPRSIAYFQDDRHVSAFIVDEIVDRVVAACCPEMDIVPKVPDEVEAEPLGIHDTRYLPRLMRSDVPRALALYARLDIGETYATWGYDEFSFRYQYGRCLMAGATFAKALLQFERCMELKPASAAANYNAGLILARLQRTLDAEDCFRRAAGSEEASTAMHARLILQLVANGKLDAAHAELASAETRYTDPQALEAARDALLQAEEATSARQIVEAVD